MHLQQRKYLKFILLGAVFVALAGCGNKQAEPTSYFDEPGLTSDIATARVDIAMYCAAELDSGSSNAEFEAASGAVDDLIDWARAHPEFLYDPDGEGAEDAPATMADVLGDAASNVDSCAPVMATRLDRARESLAVR